MHTTSIRDVGLLVFLMSASFALAAPVTSGPARELFPPGDVRNMTPEEAADLLAGNAVFETRVRVRWDGIAPEEQVLFIRQHPEWLPGVFLLGWNDLTAGEKHDFLFWFPAFAAGFQTCWDEWGLEDRLAFTERHPDAVERIGVRRDRDGWWRPTLSPHAGHEWIGSPPGRGELAVLRMDKLERGE